jgi:2-methylcitrate dehydratase PrpD
VRAVEDWMTLVGGDPAAPPLAMLDPFDVAPAVPGGLAIKLFPCCYALQRPLAALASLGPQPAQDVRRIRVRTPAGALAPLIHHRPATGLEGKFSLEYGLAAVLLDGRPGIESFTDRAVARSEARRLSEAVEVLATAGGDHLLAGEVEIEIQLEDGAGVTATLALPPGAPDRPPTDAELREKLELCAADEADGLAALSWPTAADYLRSRLAA